MHEMKKAGLPPAVFENRRGVFKVTLYNREHPSLVLQSGRHRSADLTDQTRRLLAYCSVPRSRTEIADYMGIQTPSYVVQRYLRPLLDAKKLHLTIPDAPKSKNQRYVSGGE